jgi:phosphoribosylformylglycinamidine synthase
MSTEWKENNEEKSVTSPLSLVVSGFSPVKDITIAVTPELKHEKESVLLFIDLAKTRKRMGGSILAQVNTQTGGESPDVECIEEMPSLVESIFNLLNQKKILAYHDRSDGGLITTLAEMSFASRLGLNLNLNSLLKDKTGLVDLLFNEELGIVIQVLSRDLNDVLEAMNKTGLKEHIYNIGTISERKKNRY